MSPRKKKPVAVHMEFVLPIWLKRYPGCSPPLGAATVLAPMYRALGDEEASNRLRRYLDETPAQYINLSKFVATHSFYANEAPRSEVVRKGGNQSISEIVVKSVKYEAPPEVDVELDPVTGRYRPKPLGGT